jgi:hypothetical protein
VAAGTPVAQQSLGNPEKSAPTFSTASVLSDATEMHFGKQILNELPLPPKGDFGQERDFGQLDFDVEIRK